MKDFATLFRGRDDVYGQSGPLRDTPTEAGKRVPQKHITVRKPVTPELYENHLAGKERLGIMPVYGDNVVSWLCIDVDHYKTAHLHAEIAEKIITNGLPLVMTRSKSNGAHLWAFFTEPVPAVDAIRLAQSWQKRLALPEKKVEIFPAQTEVRGAGSGVNLPYFGNTCRAIINHLDVPLEEFVALANSKMIDARLVKVKVVSQIGLPPCIDFILENGVPEGYRSHAVTQYAIAMRKAHPDDWEDRVYEFNEDNLDEPLRRDEVTATIRSVATKDYAYLCNKIKAIYCNATECKKREFGIGKDVALIDIDKIEKFDGEVPMFRVYMYGKRFNCRADELTNFSRFHTLAFAQTNKILPYLSNAAWREQLSLLMEDLIVHEPGTNTQDAERVIHLFKDWTRQSITATSLEEAFDNLNPFFAGNMIIFDPDKFMSNVDKQLRLSRDKTWIYMKDWGCHQAEYIIHGKKRNFWVYLVSKKEDLWFETEKPQ